MGELGRLLLARYQAIRIMEGMSRLNAFSENSLVLRNGASQIVNVRELVLLYQDSVAAHRPETILAILRLALLDLTYRRKIELPPVLDHFIFSD